VKADKTKYMVMSEDQTAGQSDSSSFESVEELKYYGKILKINILVRKK
jgi:hypothetical protein